jgi:hypothetical protein
MRDPRDSPFGVLPKFDIGDEVKVWPVFKRPIGTVQGVANPGQSPTKFTVQYTYEDGRVISEAFLASDLTLHRRFASKYAAVCECGSTSSGHSAWCPKFNRV